MKTIVTMILDNQSRFWFYYHWVNMNSLWFYLLYPTFHRKTYKPWGNTSGSFQNCWFCCLYVCIQYNSTNHKALTGPHDDDCNISILVTLNMCHYASRSIWDLVWNANSWAVLQIYWIKSWQGPEIWVSPSLPGDFDARFRFRATALFHSSLRLVPSL
jgi:hypothetical protein